MHPTISEQLTHVSDLLRQAGRATLPPSTYYEESARLRKLARTWDQVIPFLAWDNDAMTALLAAEGIDVPAAPTDTAFDATHAHNKLLREILSNALETAPERHRLTQLASAHLRERLARDPWHSSRATVQVRPAAHPGLPTDAEAE